MEKNFRRLLISTEKLLEEKSIEDWKVNQVREKSNSEIFQIIAFLVCQYINRYVKRYA